MKSDLCENIQRLELKLANIMEDKYCGLFSVADYLTNVYCKVHQIKDKNIYFDFILRQRLAFFILNWLNSNRAKYIPFELDIKKEVRKVKNYINKLRKKEFRDWVQGKTELYINHLKKKEQLKLTEQYYFDAFSDVCKYNVKKIKEFKKEVGLC